MRVQDELGEQNRLTSSSVRARPTLNGLSMTCI